MQIQIYVHIFCSFNRACYWMWVPQLQPGGKAISFLFKRIIDSGPTLANKVFGEKREVRKLNKKFMFCQSFEIERSPDKGRECLNDKGSRYSGKKLRRKNYCRKSP